ncbi:MAG: hypothetical protein Q9210_002463 [Variospora velana]
MLGVIDNWVLRDVIAERRAKMNIPAQNAIAEPFFLLKHYRLICGLFTFALKARYQELCVAFVNAWGSVMYAGHLYNAVRQEHLLAQPWRDMELAIMLQSPGVFFVGNRPNSLEEYARRFMLTIGVSVTAFANNRRKNGAVASKKGPRLLKELGPVWKLFAGRYCNNERFVSFTIESIRPVIEGKLDDEYDNDATWAPASKAKKAPSGSLLRRKPKRNPRAIPALDFLEDVANALHADGLDLSLDYLMLHRFCWRLLCHINDECKPRFLEMYGGGYLEKENQLPFVVGDIFSAAVQASALAGHLGAKRKGEVNIRLLLTATEALAEFFREEGDDFQATIMRHCHGYDVDFGRLADAVTSSTRQ